MKKRYLNDLVKKCILTRFFDLHCFGEFISPYLRFPQLRKFLLKEKGVHKSWYHFFEFQYKTLGYIYIAPVWQIHKVLNKNVLSWCSGIYINDFTSEEWDYLVNKYEKKI